MENDTRSMVIFCMACGLSLVIRLVPFRLPNSEPLLMLQMPLGKRYGGLFGFLFGALSIILFDVCSSTMGIWTCITVPTYGLLGLVAARLLRNADVRCYVLFAIGATLFYDGLTGIVFGPVLFGQTLYESLVGQLPFTIMHLVSNVALAALVSPQIDKVIQTYNNVFSRVEEIGYARCNKI